MKKDSKLSRRWLMGLSGIVFCMSFVCGCGMRSGTDAEEEEGNVSYSDSADFRYDLENDYNAYEMSYSSELEIGNEKISLEIWSSNIGRKVVKIDSQEIPIKNQELPLGGAGLEVKAYDFTDDGKEEIVLIESQGASGAVQDILVFANTDGQWDEMDIPSEIYKDTPEFVEKQLEELNKDMDDITVYNRYRIISFEKEKILIDYQIFADTDSGSIDMGTIQKELLYSPDEKKFMLGNTLFIPSEDPR